jgi:Protein of unknown function (DUF3738)
MPTGAVGKRPNQVQLTARAVVWSVVMLLLSNRLAGQTPRQFEVASIRPSAAAPGAGTNVGLFEGGRVRIVNEPVKLLLRMAFQLQDAQIAGGPGWLDTDRYDIEAKTGGAQKSRGK